MKNAKDKVIHIVWNENRQSRRDFLKKGALTAFFMGSGLGSGLAFGSRNNRIIEEGRAKNVIVLVSDGMSSGTLNMADMLLRRRDGRPSNWIDLYEKNEASRALMDMASANRLVTDSSAASSSWGCGKRINNGGVNWGPDGEAYKPVLPVFRDAGKSTGLVTTAEITHATPAGFAANVESRGLGEKIAEQYLEREIDVLLGGGNRHFAADHRDDAHDLYADYKKKGYHVAHTKNEFLSAANDKTRLLGVFANGHLPYSLDQSNTLELRQNVPTLTEMTEVALNKLSRNPEGFILQIEGGRVDHAAHGNDIGGLLHDQTAFDDAIGLVRKFTENRDDTLVIITTDHGNANPGLSSGSNDDFDRVQKFSYTNAWVHSQIDENSSVSKIRDVVYVATKIDITKDQAEAYRKAVRGEYEAIYGVFSHPRSVLGQILANYTNVNFMSRSHTADYVELAAYGPGSEAINGLVKNTELFNVMTKAANVTDFVEI